MLGVLRYWTRGGRRGRGGSSRRDLVQKYTEELSQITAQIHDLERNLKKGQDNLAHAQSQVTFYGLSLVMFVIAFAYWHPRGSPIVVSMAAGVGVALMVIVKWIVYRLDRFVEQKRRTQLSRLHGLHQEKLEKLKEETNFNATNTIIQRFSSGENHSEDAKTLLDEELSDKHKQLQELKDELLRLGKDDHRESQQEKEKWFDKVLGVLSGGNDTNSFPKPIFCHKCKNHCGAYRFSNKPLRYVCPSCNWHLDEFQSLKEAQASHD